MSKQAGRFVTNDYGEHWHTWVADQPARAFFNHRSAIRQPDIPLTPANVEAGND